MSVTLQYCVKTRGRRRMRSLPPLPLVFWCQQQLTGDNLSLSAKRSTPCENRRAVHISPHNSGTVIDSANVQSTQIESRLWTFQRAINQRRASPLTFPKWGSDTQICRFRRNFDQKPLKVCYKVSLSNNFQWQSCSAVNYLSNGVDILAGDDPVPSKIWA